MQIYLVGGAVRDKLLALPERERDWVVVGSNPDEMLKLGYRRVGKDFPVFLHPDSSEEYALARTERKTGRGHTGFDCDASETVTLNEDLLRRDLTINAIAEDSDGQIIDPLGGRRDLQQKLLRHTSAAFAEDPLRVLRVARFLATFDYLGFRVAPETEKLCAQMVAADTLEELPAERIFKELEKALGAKSPHTFFTFLHRINATTRLWPELTEIDFARLADVVKSDTNAQQRFAILFMASATQAVVDRCKALKVPNAFTNLAAALSRHFTAWRDASTPTERIDLLYQINAYRNQDFFHLFSSTCQLVNNEERHHNWVTDLDFTSNISAADVDSNLKGADIGDAIKQEKINQLLER